MGDLARAATPEAYVSPRDARELDAWSDETLRETVDAWEMAHRVLVAALRMSVTSTVEQTS